MPRTGVTPATIRSSRKIVAGFTKVIESSVAMLI
jgi:hypothetical protein